MKSKTFSYDIMITQTGKPKDKAHKRYPTVSPTSSWLPIVCSQQYRSIGTVWYLVAPFLDLLGFYNLFSGRSWPMRLQRWEGAVLEDDRQECWDSNPSWRPLFKYQGYRFDEAASEGQDPAKHANAIAALRRGSVRRCPSGMLRW